MQKIKQIRQIIAFFFIVGIFLFLMFLLFLNIQTIPRIKIGEPFPAMPCAFSTGAGRLEPADVKAAILILFHQDCEHCLYQLKQINSKYDHFPGWTLIFMTADPDFDWHSIPERWPNLTRNQWVKVDSDTLYSRFGRFGIPAFFLFGDDSRLIEKQTGEMKISKVLTLLRRHETCYFRRSGTSEKAAYY